MLTYESSLNAIIVSGSETISNIATVFPDKCSVLDNSYSISCNLHVGSSDTLGGTLTLDKCSLTFNGSWFIVRDSSKLIIKNSMVVAKNITMAYGFGGFKRTPSGDMPSGDLLIENSVVDIPCFWGFFSNRSEQSVSLLNSTIRGWGRIKGVVIINVNQWGGSKDYGNFTFKTPVHNVTDWKLSQTGGNDIYYAAEFSGNLIINGGNIGNATIACMSTNPTTTSGKIELLNVSGTVKNANIQDLSTITMTYTLYGTLMDENGDPIKNQTITVYNSLYNKTVTTDYEGYYSLNVVVYKRTKTETKEDYEVNIKTSNDNNYKILLKRKTEYNVFSFDPTKNNENNENNENNYAHADWSKIPKEDAVSVCYILGQGDKDTTSKSKTLLKRMNKEPADIIFYQDNTIDGVYTNSIELLLKRVMNGEIKEISTINSNSFGRWHREFIIWLINQCGVKLSYYDEIITIDKSLRPVVLINIDDDIELYIDDHLCVPQNGMCMLMKEKNVEHTVKYRKKNSNDEFTLNKFMSKDDDAFVINFENK